PDLSAEAASEAAAPPASEHLLPHVAVLPGSDLADLVVGEARPLEAAPQDLAGLRLAQTEAEAAAPADAEEGEWIEVEEEVEEPVEAAAELLPTGFASKVGDEIDDDIRDIFLEEVGEEIGNLKEQLPRWKADTANLEQLTPIRRSFHTLKGSGRLVGAATLGEFSWKVENMLNRVLDRTIGPTDAVVDLVERALASVGDLLAALRGDAVNAFRVNAIMDAADRLAAGEDARVAQAPPASLQTVRRTVRRRVRVARPAAPPSQVQPIEATAAFGPVPTPPLVASPLPNIDPVLFDILQTEVATHIGAIDDYLQQVDPQAAHISEPLLRAVHTFHGAVAMVDIPALDNVLAPLETYLKRLRAAKAPLPAAGLDTLRETCTLTREVMRQLSAQESPLPDSTDLATRISALRDTVPEPAVALPWYSDGSDSGGGEELTEVTLESGVELSFEELADDAAGAAAIPAAPATPEAGPDTTAAMQALHAEVDAQIERAAAPAEHSKPAAPDSVYVELASLIDESAATAPIEAAPTTAPVEPDAAVAAEAGASADAPATAAAPAATVPAAEPAPAPVSTELTGPAALPLAEDPMPDGQLVLPDVDDDLLDVFVAEGEDILDHVDGVVAQLRARPHDHELISALQRDLHTLKGGARMASLAPIGDLSHAMESLVDALGEGRVRIDRASVETLERGFDRLHVLVERVASRSAIAMPLHAIARMYDLVPGIERPAGIPGPAQPAAPAVERAAA
ncbi:MAG: hybrid sensor histidine kinase/response regulator, partial [Dokdonella sp.]